MGRNGEREEREERDSKVSDCILLGCEFEGRVSPSNVNFGVLS